jgi:cytochrome c biogenesis protein CcdA
MRINKNFRLLLISLVLFASLATMAYADSHIPIGLQKILDYNLQSSKDIATKVSFLFAFLAGMLGILSPCILPFLPSYFAYTFKEKKNITMMTFIFFLGFSTVFTAMGVIAGFIGERSLIILQTDWLVTIAGSVLIVMGVLSIFGKGFSGLIVKRKNVKNDIPGTFIFGVFYAIGWSACLGPILVGILGIGALLHNPWHSALLLFFYSLGNLVPLFILAVFYDSLDLGNSKFIKGKTLTFTLEDNVYHIDSIKLISGLLFILVGGVMVLYKGTSVVNTWDIFGTKQYFYSVQNSLLNWQYSNMLGALVFVIFIAGMGYFYYRRKKED